MSHFACNILVSSKQDQKHSQKWPWFWSPIYCSVWFLLFYVVVIPSYNNYPETLLIKNEAQHADEFIGERAQLQLMHLTSIGIRLAGTIANEIDAINFLKTELNKIIEASRTDLYTIEIEQQYASGKFYLWQMAMSYHNITNVVVKISPKVASSDTYLLVNAHYDTEVGAIGAADDGVMIVIMLETLRVISQSERVFKNPIVFLFNGAEEANLLASHGFITQHKWAANCKAVINLDSAGGGGRELLFQAGPNHPWLMKYYKQSVPHPYAMTAAEEMFQNEFIPSDTDFRIFRDYGAVPGLDMAHNLNGYIYHTKYDNFQNVQRGTYQTTGENVLALTWALANAPELQNTSAHAEGHTVFYDFLGWSLIYYTQTTGNIINILVTVLSLIFIILNLHQTSLSKSAVVGMQTVYLHFLTALLIQVVSVTLAFGLTLLVAVLMSALNLAESWYYHTWLTFGLYFCTIFFGLGILPASYISWSMHKTSMKLEQSIACFMHAHCMLLALACIIMTSLSIRSAYLPMLAVFFYTLSLILQSLSKLFTENAAAYIAIHLVCQLLPFWFYTYQLFSVLQILAPMEGRNGPTSKPEFIVAGLIYLITVQFAGFILPILYKFGKSIICFTLFGVLSIIFIIIAATPVGFPFVKNFGAQRYYVLHTQRTLYNTYGSDLAISESGFYVQPVDTRYAELYDTVLKNAEPQSWTEHACATEPFCGLPLYSGRWLNWRNSAHWIHATAPKLPVQSKLTLSKLKSLNANTKRFEFTLTSADRVVIYLQPYENVKFDNWSFDDTLLRQSHRPPYFIYHVHSFVVEPFTFWLELQHDVGTTNGSYFKIGVGALFLHHTDSYTEAFKTFLQSFPDWTYTTNWIASYVSWIY